MAINNYFIGGYWWSYFLKWLLVGIDGYFKLNYHIGGYQWLLVAILLMAIGGYFISGYFIDGYFLLF